MRTVKLADRQVWAGLLAQAHWLPWWVSANEYLLQPMDKRVGLRFTQPASLGGRLTYTDPRAELMCGRKGSPQGSVDSPPPGSPCAPTAGSDLRRLPGASLPFAPFS